MNYVNYKINAQSMNFYPRKIAILKKLVIRYIIRKKMKLNEMYDHVLC